MRNRNSGRRKRDEDTDSDICRMEGGKQQQCTMKLMVQTTATL